MTTKFIVAEYVMSTTMEWIACGLLLATYFLPGEQSDDYPDAQDNSQLAEQDSRVKEVEGI